MKSITAKNDVVGGGRMSGSSVRWALTCLALSMLLSSLGTSIANVSLPTLARTFNATLQQVQWVVLAYLLAITTVIVSVGRLGDLAGRRRVLLVGVMLFTLASVLCGVVSTLGLLIGARAMQGLGAAVMMALTMAFIGETVSPEKTGSAMGLLGTMSAVGTALGPTLGGVLIAALGWRAIFLVNVPLGILTFFLALRYLPVDLPTPKARTAGFDHPGTLILALTLAAYALAMTVGRGNFGRLNMVLLSVALAGVWLFVFTERRAASPLIQIAMFRDHVLRASLAMSALVSTVMMTTLVVGPFYLSRAFGLNTSAVGLILSAGPIAAALTGVPAGRLADRFGAQVMMIVGLGGIVAGSVALSIMPLAFGLVGYIAPLLVITTCYALFQTANNTAVMTDVRPDQRGVISGMLNLARNLGLITGPSVMGAVFACGAGASNIMTALPRPSLPECGSRSPYQPAWSSLRSASPWQATPVRGGAPVQNLNPVDHQRSRLNYAASAQALSAFLPGSAQRWPLLRNCKRRHQPNAKTRRFQAAMRQHRLIPIRSTLQDGGRRPGWVCLSAAGPKTGRARVLPGKRRRSRQCRWAAEHR